MWKLTRLFSLLVVSILLMSADIKEEFDVKVELIGKTVEEKPKKLPPDKLQEREEEVLDLSSELLEPPKYLEFVPVKPYQKQSGISCGEPKDLISYRLGVDYYLKGEYKYAKEELSKVIAMPSPFKPMAQYVLGIIYSKEGNNNLALELFKDSCRFSHIYQKASCESYYALSFKLKGVVPENNDPLWSDVESIKRGRMRVPVCEDAVYKDYCQYVRSFYEGREGEYHKDSLRLRRGILLFQKGELSKAEEIFKEYSLPAKPYREIALYYMGVIQLRKGDEKSALSYASILETLNPKLSENLYALISSRSVLVSRLAYSLTGNKSFLERAGIIAYNLGDYRLALYNFLEAGSALYAVYSSVKLGDYAKAYQILKDKPVKSKEEYEWLLESAYWLDKDLGPILAEVRDRYPEVYKEYTGWDYFKRGDWESAVKYLEDPYYKALAYFNMKDYQKVLDTLKNRNSLKDRVLKAKASLFMGDTSLARSFLTPQTDEELYLLGLSYFLEGKYKEAVEFFERVLQSSPLRPKALLKLADALYNQGNTQKAQEYYYKVLREYPNTEEARYATLSLIGMGGKEIGDERMEKLLEEYLKRYPDSPQALDLKYQLAQVYIRNGKEQKAKEILFDLINTPLQYKAILSLAQLEEDPTKRVVFLYKVYKEGNEEERKIARDKLIEFYANLGDRKSLAELLAEGEDRDKAKAISVYLSMGDLSPAQSLADELIKKGYRDREFEEYLLELYKATKSEPYLDYLKSSKDEELKAQALYLSAQEKLKKGQKKEALEDLVSITLNAKNSSLYNRAIIDGAKILIDLKARKDASCLLDRADLGRASLEELNAINSLKKGLPKCEVR